MLPTSKKAPFPPSPDRPLVVFDLDGTLIDSVPDLCKALNQILSEDNRRSVSEAEVSNMVGNGVHKLISRGYAATGTALDAEQLDRTVERFLGHYNDAPAALTRVYPGVIQTLEALRQSGTPMAVCTNKPQAPTEDILRAFDLEKFFTVVLGAGPDLPLKPAPDMLHAVCEIAEHTGPAYMVGDSPNDSEAAKAAGWPILCVSYGYRRCTATELQGDVLVDHFADLLPAIEHLTKGIPA